MNKITSALLLLAFVLGACASSPTPAATLPIEPAPETDSAPPAESTTAETSEQAPAAREAIVSEFENEVVVRATSEGEFILATAGFILQQGGALQTSADGRARLDLQPEGTVVRVAPNSAFTLAELTETNGEPKSAISLFFGKIFVMLNGGSLDVQTPSGVASVRGSLLSVSFNPESKRVQAVCLEGVCSLENEGGEIVELGEGESAFVDEEGSLNELDAIDQDEILDWLEEAPELDQFMEETPNPEEYFELEGFEEFEFDPSLYFDEQTSDDQSGFWVVDEDNPMSGDEPATDTPGEELPADDGSGEEPPPSDSGDDSSNP